MGAPAPLYSLDKAPEQMPCLLPDADKTALDDIKQLRLRPRGISEEAQYLGLRR